MSERVVDRLAPPPGARVLITAGAGGIGAVIAEAFAAAGGHVHVCDVDEAALAELAKRSPGIIGWCSDVSAESEVDELFNGVRDALGGLDVVVNNAGIAGPTGAVDSTELDEWRRTIDVNLNGQFLIARRAAPLLRASGGLLANMASVAGRLGYPFRSAYAASKWGVVGLTESLARELGPDGVRVNAILPGIVRGKRIESVIRARAQAVGIRYEAMEQQYLEKISLRRMVEPEDVAACILFLASPGGANISGQSLSICGNVETL